METTTIQILALALNTLIIPMLWVLIGIKSELADMKRWLNGHEKDIDDLKQDIRLLRAK